LQVVADPADNNYGGLSDAGPRRRQILPPSVENIAVTTAHIAATSSTYMVARIHHLDGYLLQSGLTYWKFWRLT
jgi:hypothetical protein